MCSCSGRLRIRSQLQIIRPLLLRRLKQDVASELPEKVILLLWVYSSGTDAQPTALVDRSWQSSNRILSGQPSTMELSCAGGAHHSLRELGLPAGTQQPGGQGGHGGRSQRHQHQQQRHGAAKDLQSPAHQQAACPSAVLLRPLAETSTTQSSACHAFLFMTHLLDLWRRAQSSASRSTTCQQWSASVERWKSWIGSSASCMPPSIRSLFAREFAVCRRVVTCSHGTTPMQQQAPRPAPARAQLVRATASIRVPRRCCCFAP